MTRRRLRLNSNTRSVEHGVPLGSCDCLEGLRVSLPVQIEPLMVAQQSVDLLRLINLFLIRKMYFLGALFADPLVELQHKLFDFFSRLRINKGNEARGPLTTSV